MDRTIKINDYVTHEKQSVQGDSSGNFTISPLGFPTTNKSHYGEQGGTVPTTFNPEITSTKSSSAYCYIQKSNITVENVDSDNNMFAVDCSIGYLSNTSYSLTLSDAQFVDSSHQYSVYITSDAMQSLNGKYTLTIQDDAYVITPESTTIVSITSGETIAAKVSYIPSDGDIISLSAQDDSTENGIYKLYVDTVDSVNHIKWIRKGDNPSEGYTEGITFDGTENDNVEDHYRKGKSDAEVSSYLNQSNGAVNTAGKFYGEQYNPSKHGMLVEWFLSNGQVNLSKNANPIYIDAFGQIPQEETMECSDETSNDDSSYSSIHNKTTNWILDTTGSDESHLARDWPYNSIKSYHNNITLSYKDNPQVGGRHNIVMRTDLSSHDNIIAPRKTFIHLPTPLSLTDGYEYEFNISMPVINVDSDNGTLTEQKLSGYTSYVTQPRAFLLSGKQYMLKNNQMNADTLDITSNGFSFFTKKAFENTTITQIAFNLYNRCGCNRKYPFIGNVSYSSSVVNLISGTTDSILYATGVLKKYDEVIIMHTSSSDKIIRTVISVKQSTDGVNDIIKLSSPVSGDSTLLLLRTKISVSGTFPFDTKSRVWNRKCKDYVCMLDIRYLENSETYYEGLTERDNGSIFGVNPEVNDIDESISKYNQNFRINATEYGKIDSEDKSVVIATVYPTATNTFAWKTNGRNKIRHLGLSTKASVDYLVSGTDSKPITRYVYDNNKKIMDFMTNSFKITNLPIEYLSIDYATGSDSDSVIGNLLRVSLPEDLTNLEEFDDTYYVVKQATSAYYSLIRDMKVSRIGYRTGISDSEKENWFTADSHSSGYIDDFKSLYADAIEPYTSTGAIKEQKMAEWKVKLLHIPNSTLGVYPNSSERNYDFSGFNEQTYDASYKVFYSSDIDEYLSGDNMYYQDSKSQTGTTQKYEETFGEYSLLGKRPGTPYDYASKNSILNAFNSYYDGEMTAFDSYCNAINGFMEIKKFNRGLRDVSYLTNDDGEINPEYQYNEMFYPTARLFSADGIVFPDYKNDASMKSFITDDALMNQMRGYPLEMMMLSELCSSSTDKLDESDYALISSNWDDTDTSTCGTAVTKYVKKLLTMVDQNMPHHLYNAHRVSIRYANDSKISYITGKSDGEIYRIATQGTDIPIISEQYTDESSTFINLIDKYSYRHEISLYQEMLKKYSRPSTYMKMHVNDDFTLSEDTSMTAGDVKLVDPNMDYAVIDETAWNELFMPSSLSSGMDTASCAYMASKFGQSYTRIHIAVIFSASLGRWVIKDYYQLPTNYLTPLYGAETLGYMEKSYTSASEDGIFKNYKCQKEYLWVHKCSSSVDYKSGEETLYSEQAPLEINPGCIPFLLEKFPYDKDGKLQSISGNHFRNLYESIRIPMNAEGKQIGNQMPGVNFWNIKWNIRPARSAIPYADIPSLESRSDTSGNISVATLGCFKDVNDTSAIPQYETPAEIGYNLTLERDKILPDDDMSIYYDNDDYGFVATEKMSDTNE